MIFVLSIVLIAVVSIESAVSLIDGSFALMAIPTMVSAILLAPRVLEPPKSTSPNSMLKTIRLSRVALWINDQV